MIKIKRKSPCNNFTEKWTQIAKRLLSISIPITLSASIMSITNIIDLGLIMRSLGKIGYSEGSASALYGNYTTLAVPMLNLAISLITPISVAFLPIFTDCLVKNEYGRFLETQRASLDLTAFVCAPITMGLMLFPKEILGLIFANSDIKIGAVLLFALAPSILLASLLINVNTILEASGRVRAPLISMIIGSLAKIAVSNYLIVETDLQILGAPIGTVISYGTALMVSLIIYAREFKTGIPLFKSNIFPFAFAFVSVKFARTLFDKSPQGPVFLILSILLSALIYFSLSAFFVYLKGTKNRKVAKSTNFI